MKSIENDDLGKSMVVLDFGASWCSPCKAMAPRLEKVSNEYPDVTVSYVDVEDNEELCEKYRVTSVPTLVFLHNGDVAIRTNGALSEDELRKEFDKFIEL